MSKIVDEGRGDEGMKYAIAEAKSIIDSEIKEHDLNLSKTKAIVLG